MKPQRWACVVLIWAAVPIVAAKDETCGSCHDQGAKVAKSAHASLGCATCHERHEDYPHASGLAKPACASCHAEAAADHAKSVHGQELSKGNAAAPDCAVCHSGAHETQNTKSQIFRAATPNTCGMCHTDIAQQFKTSVHGKAVEKGIAQAPICTDCHGEHSIQWHTSAASPVNASNIRATCGNCHGNVRLSRKFGLPPDRIITFDASFHGLAAKAGSQTVANCASCHGVHNILPSSDPASMIHVKNLTATCGKCHTSAGRRFAIGPVHLTETQSEPRALRWVRSFYLWVIPLTIGLMLLHNAGDLARKLCRVRQRRLDWANPRLASPAAPAMRMFAFERFQHIVLAVSFFALAWSGFALKYPDRYWARPVLLWESSVPVRSLIHRIAAVAFMAAAAMHVISLIASEKLRRHWKALRPAWRDAQEAAGMFLYNLGMRRHARERSRHGYVEKVEYWAVVWGGLVMMVTGLLLWANNLSLAFMPKSFLDVATAIHFCEAVLATLAILVWHFYTVIFDPDVYPMDTAWLDGFSGRHKSEEPVKEPEEQNAVVP